MAIYVQVVVTNDDTGAVVQSFVEHYATRDHPYEIARSMRAFFHRILLAVFGQDEEWE